MLKIKNIHKSFADQKVLDNLTLEVATKEIVGLVGKSGCGKSTLIRCVQKLDSIDQGEILCNTNTGFVFQDFQLFPHKTVLENITFAAHIHHIPNIKTEAWKLLDYLGIANKSSHYPSQLSGGQKQRVAIARALILKPKLLLCDEPTSGLDVATTKDIGKLLMDLRDNLNISVLLISHDIDFLSTVVDKIAILSNGKIHQQFASNQNTNIHTTLYQYFGE
ncbi:MAG: ATP-binding cassette domain-containing protein [Pseudomonadota bacterium]|nr:ATP-binding cassette domain-containing protein [Pseudomonadota bacterium]